MLRTLLIAVRPVMLSALLAMCMLAMATDSAAQVRTPLQEAPGAPHAKGEVIAKPLCFKVINRAPYTVIGGLYTNFYVDERGYTARHNNGFRLKAGESLEACSSGPFYPGRKLELVLRSLVPIFNCHTRIDGDIIIRGEHKKGGGTKTWAECRE